jgi:hypothetical protein
VARWPGDDDADHDARVRAAGFALLTLGLQATGDDLEVASVAFHKALRFTRVECTRASDLRIAAVRARRTCLTRTGLDERRGNGPLNQCDIDRSCGATFEDALRWISKRWQAGGHDPRAVAVVQKVSTPGSCCLRQPSRRRELLSQRQSDSKMSTESIIAVHLKNNPVNLHCSRWRWRWT